MPDTDVDEHMRVPKLVPKPRAPLTYEEARLPDEPRVPRKNPPPQQQLPMKAMPSLGNRPGSGSAVDRQLWQNTLLNKQAWGACAYPQPKATVIATGMVGDDGQENYGM